MHRKAIELARIDLIAGPPFLALFASGEARTNFSEFQWQGHLAIERRVTLLDEQLRLWIVTAGVASLPEVRTDSTDSPNSVTNPAARNSLQWSVNSQGELETARVAGSPRVPEICLSFLRPVCDSERVEYEFFYTPNQLMVSPALGRIALLLDGSGVNLHWMANSFESNILGLPVDNRVPVTAVAGRTKPNLIPDSWNRVRLSIQQNSANLLLNDALVANVSLEDVANRQFGFVFDPMKESVRVRNVFLSGDWPETLPVDELTVLPKRLP